ncbi:CapA family protein [Halobacillus sp. Marseille-Q1614]|uniref:CapA family protein n=1 Tax=Halobacillus sp. Marseille-Q1614 TaxID=2709134 RepID=UPI00156E4B2A|nr:CapA family protein [Halobacillus sp. Marseille-Q1614]
MKKALLVIFCLLLTACVDKTLQPQPHSLSLSTPSLKEKEFKSKISISAIGDLLIHDRVYENAKTKDGYNFMPMMQEVQPYLEDTTITIANQETMIGGKEIGLSSYPSFNSPKEFGTQLKSLGVDVVTLANNHTLDRGEKAIQEALQHWKSIGMVYTGAYKNKKDRNRVRVIETKEGIDTAILSFTYGTNGIPVPEDKPYLVNLIDKKQIAKDVKQAEKVSDLTVLSLHFGKEYETYPSDYQKDLVQFAANLGVDVVIGHHPHVLQPIEWVEGKENHRMLAIYSLGNFFSGQNEHNKRIGGIMKFDVVKDSEETTIENPRFVLTYVTSKDDQAYKVVPLHKISNELLPNKEEVITDTQSHLSQWFPELTFIEN